MAASAPSSLLGLLFFLFVGGGFGAGFPWNAFGFSAPSPFLLFVGLIHLIRLYHVRFRLNGGFTADFRRNAFVFSAPSTFLFLYRSRRDLPTAWHSLPTAWRLYSRLSTECFLFIGLIGIFRLSCIRFRLSAGSFGAGYPVSFSFSSSVAALKQAFHGMHSASLLPVRSSDCVAFASD
jgi:hypothetical protein